MMKYSFPPTTKRVPFHTCDDDNRIIRQRTIFNLDDYADGNRFHISQRLKELDFEWDTERVLEANAAGAVLLSSVIGYLKSKHCCYLMTGTIGLFLLQHALKGWCPPVPIIRKIGVRTEQEINNEKMVLKILRGDFKTDSTDAEQLLKIVEKH
jgi:hypothetical protein